MAYSIVSKKRQAVVNRAKPWRAACGAITEDGQEASSRNRTMSGLHTQEFLAIKRALNEAEALFAEGLLPSVKVDHETDQDNTSTEQDFADGQEPYFAEETTAFYANPKSNTQPTLSAGVELQ